MGKDHERLDAQPPGKFHQSPTQNRTRTAAPEEEEQARYTTGAKYLRP